jgi:hypothetical protein
MEAKVNFHWSKDFVEHLRTVHFALVVVSVVLIIANSDTSNRKVGVARNQAQEIAKFEKQWATVPAKLYYYAFSSQKLADNWSPTMDVVFPVTFYRPREIAVIVKVPKESLTKPDSWRFSKAPPAELSTLAEFRDFWNELHHGIDLIVPKEPDVGSDCSEKIRIEYANGVVETKRGVEPSTDMINAFLEEGEPISSCRIGAFMDALAEEKTYKTTFQLLPGDDKHSTLTASLEIPKEEHFHKKEGWDVERIVSVSNFELDNTRYPIHEGLLNTLFFSDWKRGEFAKAFPELDEEATRFGITTLEIDEAVRRLESESASAEKSISLIGFTIPLSLIWQWGALVLVATQLYFWLHLHEFVKKIEPDAGGWDVAWIGMYRSKAAFLLSLLSACALPLIASLYLAITIVSAHPYTPATNIAACIALISISMVLATLTAFRINDLYGGVVERLNDAASAETVAPSLKPLQIPDSSENVEGG